MNKLESTLEIYRVKLIQEGWFNVHSLRTDIADVCGCGTGIAHKELLLELFKHSRFQLVAVFVMERTWLVSEYKRRLASVYGIASYGHPECERKRRDFWKAILGQVPPMSESGGLTNC